MSTSTVYRQCGDTTLDVFTRELTRVNSPMLPDASAIHAAASPHSALFLAMAWVENQWATTGILIQPEHRNPVSLRPWREDPRGMPPGAVGVITAPDGGQFLKFASWADSVREWRRRLFDDPGYKGGVYVGASTLSEMLAIYAPSGDVHPVTGVDNAAIGYARKVSTMLDRFTTLEEAGVTVGQGAAEQAGAVAERSEATNAHIYALSMGHRNTDRGGARGEIDWTPWATRELAAALRGVGATVYIVHEHDGDDDRDFTKQGLDSIGGLVNAIDRTHGPLTAYLSMHYNGGRAAGFHAIYPDGWDGVDEAANNPRDIELARAIKRRVAATETVGFLGWPGWKGPERGVMSERDTGAVSNRRNYRLSEMRQSMGCRAHAVRLILEAGSIDTDERRYITNRAWVKDVYCSAILDGLRDVFGPFPNDGGVTGVTGEMGESGETGVQGGGAGQSRAAVRPKTVFVKPLDRPWAEELRNGKASVRLPDANHPQGFVTWFAVDRLYRARRDVPRQQVATDDSRFVNEPVPEGTVIAIDAVGTNFAGDAYGLSPWGTMFRLDDLEPLPWPEAPDLVASGENGEEP